MFTGIMIGLSVAALIGYVHKVGLPRVEAKIAEGYTAISGAIHTHAAATQQAIKTAAPPK